MKPILVPLALACLAVPLCAQQRTGVDLVALDAVFRAHVQASGVPGLSVGVVDGGKLVFQKGYGKRSLEDGSPVQSRTRFAIGSLTKQFTCACVLMLVEEGKLSVHDKVANFYPELKRARDVLVLDLMNHTSGYPDYYPLDFVDRRMAQPIQTQDLIHEFAGSGAR